MKEFKIEVPKGFEIDEVKSTFQKIVFKEIKAKYPLSVKDVLGREYFIGVSCDILRQTGNIPKKSVSTESRAKAFLALMQLVELRDAWNKIDGNTEWNYINSINYVIEVVNNKIEKRNWNEVYSVLHFRKEGTRDLFLETFKDLIEEAKELI